MKAIGEQEFTMHTKCRHWRKIVTGFHPLGVLCHLLLVDLRPALNPNVSFDDRKIKTR